MKSLSYLAFKDSNVHAHNSKGVQLFYYTSSYPDHPWHYNTLTTEVNNDNLITTAPVKQQMKSCFLTLGRKTGEHRNLKSENMIPKGLVQFRMLSRNQNWRRKVNQLAKDSKRHGISMHKGKKANWGRQSDSLGNVLPVNLGSCDFCECYFDMSHLPNNCCRT